MDLTPAQQEAIEPFLRAIMTALLPFDEKAAERFEALGEPAGRDFIGTAGGIDSLFRGIPEPTTTYTLAVSLVVMMKGSDLMYLEVLALLTALFQNNKMSGNTTPNQISPLKPH